MKRSTLGAALLAAAALALLLWLALRDPPDPTVEAEPPNEARVAKGTRPHATNVASSAPRSDEARGGTSPAGGAVAREGELSRREWLARAIELARDERLRAEDEPAAPVAARPPGAPPEVGHLEPDYIRERVRELVPLIRECYELALDEQAGLEGRLNVEFVIAGEPEVGGIVEESRILDESTLVHPTLHECVRETVYTLELDPPENGGRVTVRYPFNFSPE